MTFNTKGLMSSISDEWQTPKKLYEELNNEFFFNDDPCPLGGSGGLERDWGTPAFVNPPYSKIKDWIKKGYEESLKNKIVVMLIPSRTDTKYWHEYVMKAAEIRFIKGRLKFNDGKGSAPFPSAIVVFRGGK